MSLCSQWAWKLRKFLTLGRTLPLFRIPPCCLWWHTEQSLVYVGLPITCLQLASVRMLLLILFNLISITCLYTAFIPFVFLPMFHLSSQHHSSKRLPSSYHCYSLFAISHCCVSCSDPLMHELNLAMNTYKQFYLMCNWCAILTHTVCVCVSLVGRAWVFVTFKVVGKAQSFL